MRNDSDDFMRFDMWTRVSECLSAAFVVVLGTKLND